MGLPLHLLGLAGGAYPVVKDTYAAYRDHKNVPIAFAKSTLANTWPFIVTAGMRGASITAPLLFLAPALPSIAAGITGVVSMRNSYTQSVGRPFGHRTEHSDFALSCMQRGLQSINGTRSMIGNEAAIFNQRFGRSS